MVLYTTRLWLFLLGTCAVVYTIRLPPDSDEIAKLCIFDSPLYDPLASVAMHVEQFIKGVSSVTRNMEENEQLTKMMRIARLLSRVKPTLQHIVLLATSPQPPDTPYGGSNNLHTAFNKLQGMLTEAHRRTDDLATSSNNILFYEPMQFLLNSIQKALYHASTLTPSLVSAVALVHPMMEKFIIHEYIPQAEKVYTIQKNLESVGHKSHQDSTPETIEKLIDQWNYAHDKIKDSSITLLKLVDVLKNSLRKNANSEALQQISAFVSLLKNEDSEDIFNNLNLDIVDRRLDRIETSLLAIAHKQNPIVQKNETSVTIPVVISMLHPVETMAEKLNHLHNDLHATENKLRYVAARLDRLKTSGYDSIIKNNNAIRSQLNRLHHDIVTAHTALRNHMTNCIIGDEDKRPPKIDFMSPMMRFAEIEKKINTKPHAERFKMELEKIRQLLLNLHNDAERFNRFVQVIKARKAKLNTE